MKDGREEGYVEQRFVKVLESHIQSSINQRCICGWRPALPDARIGAEYLQHREHLALVLAEGVRVR